MIIDSHIHFTPPEDRSSLPAWSESEPYWAMLLSPDEKGRSLQGWRTPEETLQDMDAAGIEKAVVVGGYRQGLDACRRENERVISLVRRHPGRFLGFGMLHPHPLPQALDELQHCVDAGLCGLGELNPYAQGFGMQDADFLRLLEACIRRGLPVNLHVNEEVGHFYPGKTPTPLLDYYALACRFPELKLILAHWGGGLCFYEIMPEVRRRLQNVFYDTAATPLLFPVERVFCMALQSCGAQKILYGSDYPLRIYPRRQAQPDFSTLLHEIRGLSLQPGDLEAILGANAARLLGLDAPHSAPPPAPALHPAFRLPAEIGPSTPVRALAQASPQAAAVFERWQIPWQEGAVPFWLPLQQAAAARGLGASHQARLLAELREALAPVIPPTP